jgi:VanZ family protein
MSIPEPWSGAVKSMRSRTRTALYLAGYWGPVLAQMGLIFYFSAQPKGSPVLEDFPLPGGVGHFIGYGLLGFLLYRAFNRGLTGWSGKAAGKSLLVAFLYALSDELHQLFVPGRQTALTDVAIDTAGILLALLLVRLLQYANFRKGGYEFL